MENKPDPLQIAKGTAAKQPVFSQRPDAPEALKHYELCEIDTKHSSCSEAQKNKQKNTER